jgi:hypothetical protein
MEVILNDGDTAVVAKWPQMLRNHRRIRGGILPKHVIDGLLENVEFAAAVAVAWWGGWCVQVFGNRSTANPQMTGDFTRRPFFDEVKAVNLTDLFRWEHRSSRYRVLWHR